LGGTACRIRFLTKGEKENEPQDLGIRGNNSRRRALNASLREGNMKSLHMGILA